MGPGGLAGPGDGGLTGVRRPVARTPGPGVARALQCVVLALVVVAVCFTWVFPALSPLLPFTDPTAGP